MYKAYYHVCTNMCFKTNYLLSKFCYFAIAKFNFVFNFWNLCWMGHLYCNCWYFRCLFGEWSDFLFSFTMTIIYQHVRNIVFLRCLCAVDRALIFKNWLSRYAWLDVWFAACFTPLDGLVYLPDEFHNANISEDSPLAVLLPATTGPGLCSYVLLQYLLTEHNNFMEQYCAVLRRRSELLTWEFQCTVKGSCIRLCQHLPVWCM